MATVALTAVVWLLPEVIMSCAPEKLINMSSSMDSKACSIPKILLGASFGKFAREPAPM